MPHIEEGTLELVYWPHPALKRKASPIESSEFGDELAGLVEEMIRVMHENRGIGLAAPQVAVSKRLIVCTTLVGEAEIWALANPVLMDRSGDVIEDEGCLSFPGITGKVRRADWVAIEGQDPDGNTVVVEAEGILSRCLQHEIDHLDGLLFTRKMSAGSRIKAKRRIRELENYWGPIYSSESASA